MLKLKQVLSYITGGILSIACGCLLGVVLSSFIDKAHKHPVSVETLIEPHRLVQKLDSIEHYIKVTKIKKSDPHGDFHSNLQ